MLCFIMTCFYSSVKEEVFWRNYFYRVSLIKQSAQLTALAAQQQAVDQEEREDSNADDSHLTGNRLSAEFRQIIFFIQ